MTETCPQPELAQQRSQICIAPIARRVEKGKECYGRSEQHSHNQIKLVCPRTISLESESPQRAEFCRKQKVGAGPINEISKLTSVTGYVRINIAWRRSKPAYISRDCAILSGRDIEFQLNSRLKFELGPATRGGHCLYGRGV